MAPRKRVVVQMCRVPICMLIVMLYVPLFEVSIFHFGYILHLSLWYRCCYGSSHTDFYSTITITLLHKRFLHIHLILSHWNLLHEVISFKKWRRFVWFRDRCARAHFKKSKSESEIGRAIKTNMLEMIYIVHASNLLSNKNIFEKVTSFPP